MNNKQLYISWRNIENDCKILAKKLNNKKIDLVVAITKGGLVPAVILANKHLSKPHIITLQLEEIKKEGKAEYQAKKVKIISELNVYPIKGKKVLLLDDVADSGSTLAKATELVKHKNPILLTTAVLHVKSRSSVKPDLFVRRIPNHTWIIYPWE